MCDGSSSKSYITHAIHNGQTYSLPSAPKLARIQNAIMLVYPPYLYAHSLPLTITTHIPHQPIHALIHTPPIDRTTRHDTPIPILELAQPQRLAYLARALCAGLVLLICEYEQRGVAQLFFVEHSGEFFRGGGEAVDVCAVDDEDHGGGVGVVAAPVGADRGLAAEVL
jgi:hypothetical protein